MTPVDIIILWLLAKNSAECGDKTIFNLIIRRRKLQSRFRAGKALHMFFLMRHCTFSYGKIKKYDYFSGMGNQPKIRIK